MYLVDIVIVTYNSSREIIDCIKSCYDDSFNFIIVDNNSKDSTVELVKTLDMENINLITNNLNLGLASANNQSLPFIKSNLILILNPDTIISSASIFDFFIHFSKNHRVAVAGPSTFETAEAALDGSRWGHSFGNQFNLTDIFYHLFIPSKFKKTDFKLDDLKPIQVGWVSGHCLMIRRKVFEQIQGYDVNYFLSICDVVDLCRRVRMEGHLIEFVPSIKCIHLGSRSSVNLDVKPLALFKTVQGFLYYLRKWHGLGFMCLFYCLVMIQHILKYVIFLSISLFFHKLAKRADPHLFCIKSFFSDGVPKNSS
jgi:N-acetylglucosaminyl-diphospho-decaprenol L-rhamnosyltransferase